MCIRTYARVYPIQHYCWDSLGRYKCDNVKLSNM